MSNRDALSAAQLAAQLDDLPDPTTIDPALFELVRAVRGLVDSVVATDVSAADRAELTQQIDRLSGQLNARRREPLILVGRHGSGRIENLTQAGSGRLNPHARPVQFDPLPAPPPTGTSPSSVEVTAQCSLTEAHSGPPAKAHGGVVATLLDEVLGVAAYVAGATGLTAGINIRYRAATPLGEPLVIAARYTESDGRKHFATGEISVGNMVTASAEAIFVSPGPEEAASIVSPSG